MPAGKKTAKKAAPKKVAPAKPVEVVEVVEVVEKAAPEPTKRQKIKTWW